MSASYVFGKSVGLSHEQAVQRVIGQLAKEGFGVLSDIDVGAIAGEVRSRLERVLQAL